MTEADAGLLAMPERFDACIAFPGEPFPRPTDASIDRIEKHFGFRLPFELTYLARNARRFGDWFAGLGPDYDADTHIIRLNSYWRQRRRTRRIPTDHVAFNRGFDDDLDCFVTAPGPGEFAIAYWCPDLEDGGAVWPNFRAYLEDTVAAWEKEAAKARERKARRDAISTPIPKRRR
jgi:hypothetical protein